MRSTRRWVFALLAFGAWIVPPPFDGSIIIRPHFGHPYIFGDRIVFTSVDGRELICIDRAGRSLWKQKFPSRIYVQRAGDGKLLAQVDRDVYVIDTADGSKKRWTTMPRDEVLEVDPDSAFACTFSQDLARRCVRVLDPKTLAELWITEAIESIACVGEKTIVAVQARREVADDFSYRLADSTLVGLRRADGEVRWSLPLRESQSSSVESVAFGPYLAIRDGVFYAGLVILDPESGEVMSRPDIQPLDMDVEGDRLVILEDGDGPGQATLSTCSLPLCADRSKPITLVSPEILTFRLHRDYVITAGIYDCSGFSRKDGKRLWNKGQLEWSEPVGDSMIITDHSRDTKSARIVSVDLATGDERVLFTLRVTKRDQEEFRAW